MTTNYELAKMLFSATEKGTPARQYSHWIVTELDLRNFKPYRATNILLHYASDFPKSEEMTKAAAAVIEIAHRRMIAERYDPWGSQYEEFRTGMLEIREIFGVKFVRESPFVLR